jgi:hypothetical protein
LIRKHTINDDTCRYFSGCFYYYLLVRRFTVYEAFQRAKLDTSKFSRKEAKKIILLPEKTHENDHQHDVRIKIPDGGIEYDFFPPCKPQGKLYEHTRLFVGRHQELQTAYEYLHDDAGKNIIVITGATGMGKMEVCT